MNPKARRVLPRDAPSYFAWFFSKFSGLLEGYYTLVAYVLPEAHVRARGSVLSLSIGCERESRPHQCGDRPGGEVPAGISKNQYLAFVTQAGNILSHSSCETK